MLYCCGPRFTLLVISNTIRVVSLPSELFDGTATVNVEADGYNSPAGDEFTTPFLEQAQSGEMASSSSGSGALQEAGHTSFNATFYHCLAGSFWFIHESSAANGSSSSCQTCTDIADGDVEVPYTGRCCCGCLCRVLVRMMAVCCFLFSVRKCRRPSSPHHSRKHS